MITAIIFLTSIRYIIVFIMILVDSQETHAFKIIKSKSVLIKLLIPFGWIVVLYNVGKKNYKELKWKNMQNG